MTYRSKRALNESNDDSDYLASVKKENFNQQQTIRSQVFY